MTHPTARLVCLLALAVEAAMRSNISAFICGMMPGIDAVPVIENDLPAPVWP